MNARKPYPSDVSDEEWEFVAPYLALLPLDARQRDHDLREVFNGLRWVVRSGASWRMMPHDFPPWYTIYQQTQRWFKAGCFEAMAHDLRMLLRMAADREPAPSATVMDSRTLQSTPESGSRAGYDGAKKRKGSKVHMAVDTLGYLLTLHVTPANEQDREQVAEITSAVQEVTGGTVDVAFVDQGYTGDSAQEQAQDFGMELVVVKHTEAKRGFILLPRRWGVERSFGWMARFRRLARDYERLAGTLVRLHFVAFVCLMLNKAVAMMGQGS